MLGSRQEDFLRQWARASADADFRLVCSQTIFCKATTHSGGGLVRRSADLDCGGWPQTARNRALAILRPLRDVIMLHGDQHIGSLVRHGIEDWEDGPVGFIGSGDLERVSPRMVARAARPESTARRSVLDRPLSRRAGQPHDGPGSGEPGEEQQYARGPGGTHR